MCTTKEAVRKIKPGIQVEILNGSGGVHFLAEVAAVDYTVHEKAPCVCVYTGLQLDFHWTADPGPNNSWTRSDDTSRLHLDIPLTQPTVGLYQRRKLALFSGGRRHEHTIVVPHGVVLPKASLG